MRTESFILATPKRVIPRTSPCEDDRRVRTAPEGHGVHPQTHLVTHNISKKHQVTRIDSETVRRHSVVDLADDARASGFDSEHLLNLHDVVGRGLASNDTCGEGQRASVCANDGTDGQARTVGSHDLSQPFSFDEQLLLAVRVLLNNGTLESRYTLK